MSSTPRFRFRQHLAVPMAGFLALVGTSALATQRWWLAPLLLVPLAAIWWGLRSGTDFDDDGVRVRGALRSRRLGWGHISGLSVVKGDVYAELRTDESVRLPAVHPHFVPDLVRFAQSQTR